MTLRPLLDIALDDERFGALVQAVRDADGADVHMSAAIRPYLLAALVSSDDGLGDGRRWSSRPTTSARATWRATSRAYLAPRRVRYYPSRGTGYASHLAPPPHLVGLRIAALDALSGGGAAVVVASAVALAEAVPDASLRPAGLTLRNAARRSTSARSASCWSRPATSATTRSRSAASSRFAAASSTSSGATEDRAARLELFGDEIEQIRWFSTFTQRSLGEAEAIELAPAAELRSEHRELAELVLTDYPPAADAKRSTSADESERPDLAELLPLDSFRAPLDLIPDDTAVLVAARRRWRARSATTGRT